MESDWIALHEAVCMYDPWQLCKSLSKMLRYLLYQKHKFKKAFSSTGRFFKEQTKMQIFTELAGAVVAAYMQYRDGQPDWQDFLWSGILGAMLAVALMLLIYTVWKIILAPYEMLCDTENWVNSLVQENTNLKQNCEQLRASNLANLPKFALNIWSIGRVYMANKNVDSELSEKGEIIFYCMVEIINSGNPSKARVPTLMAYFDSNYYQLELIGFDMDMAFDAEMILRKEEMLFTKESKYKPAETRIITEGDTIEGWVVGVLPVRSIGLDTAQKIIDRKFEVVLHFAVNDIHDHNFTVNGELPANSVQIA